jgi:hypothetical protein
MEGFSFVGSAIRLIRTASVIEQLQVSCDRSTGNGDRALE